MDNTTASATENTSNSSLLKAARVTAQVLKGGSGLLVAGMGVTFLASGLALPMAFGSLALYTGGRQIFESGLELLPLKAHSAISQLFGGKPLTEKVRPWQPKSLLGKTFRLGEYAAIGVAGLAAWWAGGFVLTSGTPNEGRVLAFMFGGLGLAASGIVGAAANVISGMRSLIRKQDKSAGESALAVAAPEVAPAPMLASKASAPSFNQSATPGAAPDHAPAAETKPAPLALKM